MNFHADKDFEDAILKTAEEFKLLPIFIEKDYWVSYVLRNLSRSGLSSQIIFKGGTSLAKGLFRNKVYRIDAVILFFFKT